MRCCFCNDTATTGINTSYHTLSLHDALPSYFADRRTLAVDVPSGIDSDGTSNWMPPLPADVTLALGALKPAHVLLPTAPACGRVLLAPIGISANKVMRTLPRTRETKPKAAAHKFTRSMVQIGRAHV